MKKQSSAATLSGGPAAVPPPPPNNNPQPSTRDERAEKLKKKAKNFLDERQRPKARATSLWNYIDATNNFDQARFFQDNVEQVFQVIEDVCIHQIEKIKQNDRPQSWTSREMNTLQKQLLLMRKLFLYVPELMRNGWQRGKIANLLTHILDHRNHPRLRLLGFRLLLLWLNDQVVEYPECMKLFANAVSLDLFLVDDIRVAPGDASTGVVDDIGGRETMTSVSGSGVRLGGMSMFIRAGTHGAAGLSTGAGVGIGGLSSGIGWGPKGEAIKLGQGPIIADNRPPLFPNPNPPTFYDSISLFNVFVYNLVRLAYVAAGSPPPPEEYEYPLGDNIEADDGIATGVGIDAAAASAKFLFKIFRQCYLVKLVPEIARRLEIDTMQGTPVNFGFPACPPTILRTMLTFLIRYCLDNNASPALPSSPFFPSPSPATPILKSIVFSTHENRELLHEILRQCLVLPPANPQYRDIVRGAIHIMGVWALSGEEERPAFLRRTNLTPSSSTTSLSTLAEKDSAPPPNPELTLTVPPPSVNDKPLTAPLVLPSSCAPPSNYSDANVYLRRYFRYVGLVFEDHALESIVATGTTGATLGSVGPGGIPAATPGTSQQGQGQQGQQAAAVTSSGVAGANASGKDVTAAAAAGMGSMADWEAVVALYKDALGFYRAVMAVGVIELEKQSWETMLKCLLEIQAHIMNKSDKFAVIPVPTLAEELADYTVETLLHAFVRSNTANAELWTDLKKQMAVATRWEQAVGQWVKIVNKLTRLLSTHLYCVDIDSILGRVYSSSSSLSQPIYDYLNGGPTNRTRPRSTKVRTRHLSLHEQSPSARINNQRSNNSPVYGPVNQLVDSQVAQRLSLSTMPNSAPVDQSSSSSTSTVGTAREVRDDARPPAPQPSSSSTLTTPVASPTRLHTDRMSRRAMSVHQDFNALWTESNSKLLSLVHPSGSSSSTAAAAAAVTAGANNGASLGLAADISVTEESGEEDEHDFSGNGFGVHGSPSSGSGVAPAASGGENRSSIFGGGGGKEGRERDREQRREIAILGAIGMSSGISAISAESGYEGGKGQGYIEGDRRSVASLNDRGGVDEFSYSTKSNRTSASSMLPGDNFGGTNNGGTNNGASATDRLPSVLAIFKSSEFGNLATATPWDGQGVLTAWKNVVCSLGNVNAIQNPQNYATAMTCLVEVWDVLAFVRAHQPFAGVPVPALYELAPWFFQAADLPSTHAIGRAAAYGCLCRVMCRRADQLYPEEFLSHFYQTFLKGLASTDDTVVHAILVNSVKLFVICLPGSYLLVPTVVETIGKVLLEDTHQSIPEEVYQSCLTILASLVSVPNHFAGLRLPLTHDRILRARSRSVSALPEVEFSQIKVMLKDIFVGLIAAENSPRRIERSSETHSMLLGSVCVLMLDELTSSSPDRAIVNDCLLSLLDHLYMGNLPIVNVAVDCLNALAQNYRADSDPDGLIVQEVFGRLIDALNTHLKLQESNPKTGRGCIIARLYYCMLEWLMVIEPQILTDTELCQLVFDVLEYGLHIASDDTEKILPHPPPSHKGQRKRDLQLKFKLGIDKRPALNSDSGNVVVGADVGEEDDDFVKTAAESVLLHILHHFNNFPPPFGPAMINSTILGPGMAEDKSADENFEQYQYFTFNDTTLITFIELPRHSLTESQARIIIRDVTGRYTWDSQLFYKSVVTSNYERVNGRYGLIGGDSDVANSDVVEVEAAHIGVADRLLLREDIAIREPSKTTEVEQEQYKRKQGEAPGWKYGNDAESTDMLDQLLQYIGETSPDYTMRAGVPLNIPVPLSPTQQTMISSVDAMLNRHIQEELECAERPVEAHTNIESPSEDSAPQHNINRDSADMPKFPAHIYLSESRPTPSQSTSISSVSSNPAPADYSLSKTFVNIMPPEAEKPHVPYQECRLLMSHLGFLNYDYLKDGSFYMLNKTPALYRDIRGLDRKHGRETMKIAVIYVGPGQEDEQSILHNAQGSPMYDDFVASLGWEVDLATHPGYLGGLERNMTNGTRATYYCSSTVELIFHDATKMPTDPHDLKQVRKKRHIGNDHVHIVWNEHYRDYRPGTIGGDFGNAQIIITPMPNGLSVVQVHRDRKVPFFGPLFNGMVVSRAILGSLVRATAMHAFRMTLHSTSQAMYQHVYANRASDIQIITQRHKVAKWNFERFMGHIFMPNEDHKET